MMSDEKYFRASNKLNNLNNNNNNNSNNNNNNNNTDYKILYKYIMMHFELVTNVSIQAQHSFLINFMIQFEFTTTSFITYF
jgi:hypothetical protein